MPPPSTDGPPARPLSADGATSAATGSKDPSGHRGSAAFFEGVLLCSLKRAEGVRLAGSIEREIRDALNRSGSADFVVDELLARWRQNLFSPDEQRAVAQFLLNAGQPGTLLGEIGRLLQDKRAVPWAQFAEALIRSRFQLSEDDVRAIAEGLTEQDGFEDLLACREADAWGQPIRDKRRNLEAKKALRLAEKKTALRERLQFFRANRMYEEEAAALGQLQALFPEDKEFKGEEEDFQIRWAREVFANRATSRTDFTDEIARARERALTPEVRNLRDLFFTRCSELARREAKWAYDLALFLTFMEFYSDAIEVLNCADPGEARAGWLRLELLILARHYVAALEEANRLEIDHAGDPEATFAVVYARARALWGLGQAAMAIDLMRSIVNVRPQYKSASSLLAEWGGGEP